MPDDLRIATAQFENRSGDKQFNLAAIELLSAKAAGLGQEARAVPAHPQHGTPLTTAVPVDVDVAAG